MTKERAQYILDHANYGEFRYAFPREFCYQGGITHPDGITREEDAAIRALWDTLPGHTSRYDAVCRIARGEVT